MSYQEFLSFERRGAVGIVRLARPEKLNTISAPFYEAMIELQQTEIVGDHDLRAIALLADGRHFSAGIDLNYAKAVIGKPGRSLYGVYHWQQAYRFWSECNLPVVVGIQGACMGTAIELITACDIRIAADNAKFSLREVDVGISTDLGGTTRLTKLIGPGMTKLLAMTCEDIDAQEAARIRLVERVVPLGELEQTTLAYAEKLAAKPPIAVQMCKSASTSLPTPVPPWACWPRRFRASTPYRPRTRPRRPPPCSKSAPAATRANKPGGNIHEHSCHQRKSPHGAQQLAAHDARLSRRARQDLRHAGRRTDRGQNAH